MSLLPSIWTCILLAAVPTWALQTGGDDLLHVGAVEIGLHNAVQRHIWPEDQLAAVVEVQGDGILQVVEQQRVLGAMRQNLADVDAVGEQQHRLWTWRRMERQKEMEMMRTKVEIKQQEAKQEAKVGQLQKWKETRKCQLGPAVTFNNS